MKRSKILKEIQKMIRESYIVEESTAIQAEKILSGIERLGMKLPDVKTIRTKGICCGCDDCNSARLMSTDEKKLGEK